MPEAKKRTHRCCFTGHRPEKLHTSMKDLEYLLELEIRSAINRQFTTFISGMARGTDIIAAEIILRLREDDPRLKLVCAVPHADFGILWNDAWSYRYVWILSQADVVKEVRQVYAPGVYQLRNQWMVDRSSLVIAVYNGGPGGTRNTLEYARKQNIPCNIISVK